MKLKEILQSNPNQNIILFGAAAILGKLAYHAFKNLGVDIKGFYDSDDRKQGTLFCNKRILNEKELSELPNDTAFFISNQYIKSVTTFLKQKNFHNIFDCMELLENTDFSKIKMDFNQYQHNAIQREIAHHKHACEKYYDNAKDVLNLKAMDIVVTERCSMKCRDCSNLMQYYVRPQNAEINKMFKSLDRLMNSIDWLYEFRVLGGDPFMNKEVYKIINKLVEYNNVNYVVIYTNATIMPKNENFECLKNKKIILDITNYGSKLSRKHDELIKILKENNINHRSKFPDDWTDSGTLKYYDRSKEELQRVFDNCCMSDITTLMKGVLYRCPYAANATTLNAVPFKEEEVVNLNNEKYNLETLRNKIRNFNKSNKPLTACSYCGGRDFKTRKIEAAVQTKKPLEYKQQDVHDAYKSGLS